MCFQNRAMVFPAQAVRCELHGVFPAPPKGDVNSAKGWTDEIVKRIQKTCGKEGTVFIECCCYGEVGKLPRSQEFTFHVVL